jgi:hypothetical protein
MRPWTRRPKSLSLGACAPNRSLRMPALVEVRVWRGWSLPSPARIVSPRLTSFGRWWTRRASRIHLSRMQRRAVQTLTLRAERGECSGIQTWERGHATRRSSAIGLFLWHGRAQLDPRLCQSGLVSFAQLRANMPPGKERVPICGCDLWRNAEPAIPLPNGERQADASGAHRSLPNEGPQMGRWVSRTHHADLSHIRVCAIPLKLLVCAYCIASNLLLL